MTTPDGRTFDGPRMVLSVPITAGLGVAGAAAFLSYYPRANDVGPTAATLGDAFAWILGACVGLLVGSAGTAFFVRGGSRFFSGLFAGVTGFCLGVVPYLLLTTPSDVSLSDALDFALIVFAPGIVFVVGGAAIGAAFRWLLARHSS
jgi:hypothetical protein